MKFMREQLKQIKKRPRIKNKMLAQKPIYRLLLRSSGTTARPTRNAGPQIPPPSSEVLVVVDELGADVVVVGEVVVVVSVGVVVVVVVWGVAGRALLIAQSDARPATGSTSVISMSLLAA